MAKSCDERTTPRVSAVDVHVGTRIQLRRSMLGLSQDALAHALQIQPSHVAAMEEGRANISLHHLFMLAHILGVPASWFFEGLVMTVVPEQEPTSQPPSEENC